MLLEMVEMVLETIVDRYPHREDVRRLSRQMLSILTKAFGRQGTTAALTDLRHHHLSRILCGTWIQLLTASTHRDRPRNRYRGGPENLTTQRRIKPILLHRPILGVRQIR